MYKRHIIYGVPFLEEKMFIIAGLGNPKREYENTRHNIGFDVIDALAKKHGISVNETKWKGLIGKGIIAGQKVILVKPLTFMNLSGECIRQVADYFHVDPETELLVIADDISLDVGKIRIRKKGSAGGHNGLKNIILHMGTEGFPRIKMGVGEKPAGYDLADYVLGHFSKDERTQMDASIEDAIDSIELILADEIDVAMNKYNKKNTKPQNSEEPAAGKSITPGKDC